MKHYLYKITNIYTNEFYVGVRSNKDPESDKYMGSSKKWSKIIKNNKKDFIKIIINDSFVSREEANLAELALLKECKDNPLCVNILFAKIPSHLGVIQSEDWINKRKRKGKENGMYGKHHSEETKLLLSNKLKGRIVSLDAKNKIGKFHKNKILSLETKSKMSETRSKKLISGELVIKTKCIKVINLITNEIQYFESLPK